MPEAHPDRVVHCIKLDKELPALAKAPFPTEFGTEISEKVSKEAWDLWLEESVRLINTYRLDLGTREGTEFLIKQLRIWLGLEEGEMQPTAWTAPEGEEADKAEAADTSSE